MDDTHRYMGTHAAEIAGVMREPGEMFTPTSEQLKDVHMQDMLENRVVVKLSDFGKGGEKLND